MEDEERFNELKDNGFGASFTGYVFSIIHSDLVRKLINEETKEPSGPSRCGFSTNIDQVNTWVNTIHIHTMLKVTQRQQIHLKTTSKHKEWTKFDKEHHLSHLKYFKEKLSGYGTDQFILGYQINLSRGEKVNKNVYNNMCQVEILGKKNLNEFIQERLINGKVGFLDTNLIS